MADLDSFFAKKDKKKVKGRKFATTDEIAKRLEESEKKMEKVMQKEQKEHLKKLEESQEDPESGSLPLGKEEEEWNDYKAKREEDLSDLKISKLQIDEDENYGSSDEDDGTPGEGGESRRGKKGVWKSVDAPVQQCPVQEPAEVDIAEAEKIVSQISVTPLSYVLPHLRNVSVSGPNKSISRKSKLAPDISNVEAFPTLMNAQSSNNQAGGWGKKQYGDDRQGFENVKHGSTRSNHEERSTSQKLSTTNRFDALTENS